MLKNKSDDSHGNPKWAHYDEIKAKIHALLGGKCAVCGVTEALEIDHIRPRFKKREVTSMLLICTDAEIAKEAKKCQLLCHKCHMEKSVRERGQKMAKGTHGTLSSYRYCRCELCTKAHSDYCLAWKKKNKAKRKRAAKRRSNEQEKN